MRPRPLAALVLGVLSLAVAFAPSGCATSDRDEPARDLPPELRLASDVWPPFTDVPGKARVALELVQTALLRSGTPVRSRIDPEFSSVLAGLRDGSLEGCAALWRTPEREEFLLYSRPYLENRLVLVGLGGTDVSARSFSALSGRRIALVEGYAYGEAVESAEAGRPEFVRGMSVRENLERLVAGEVDLVLADELLAHHLYELNPERAEATFVVGRNALVSRSLHFAVRRDVPDAEGIIARFDAQLGQMLTSGAYHRILDLDWIRADIDGDGRAELVAGSDRAGERAPRRAYALFASESAGTDPRVHVGGRTYDDWNAVPPRYKMPIDSSTAASRTEFDLFDF